MMSPDDRRVQNEMTGCHENCHRHLNYNEVHNELTGCHKSWHNSWNNHWVQNDLMVFFQTLERILEHTHT